MALQRFRRKATVLLRRILGRQDSASRIARGVAAGVFAAAFPIPGTQIFLSLLAAWVARGNKFVAIFPQFISNAGTMFPLAYLQFKLGAWLWPAKAAERWRWRNYTSLPSRSTSNRLSTKPIC